MENSKKKEKIEIYYTVKFEIHQVWPLFKDAGKMSKVMPELDPKILILNNKKLNEKGCIYEYSIGNVWKFHGNVREIIENEKYNYIKTSCNFTTPIFLNYENVFTLFSNTINSTTFIKWEQIYIDWEKEKIPNFERLLKDSKKNMKIHLLRVKNYLKKYSEEIVQNESVILDKSQSEVWNIISDFNVFIKHVPFVADIAEYQGDPKVVGTKVVLKWTDKKVTCFIRIVSIENDEANTNWIITLECYDGIPQISKQLIIFNVMRISNEKCFLTFKHKFSSQLKVDYIALLSKEKKKILSRLSLYLSKTIDNNY